MRNKILDYLFVFLQILFWAAKERIQNLPPAIGDAFFIVAIAAIPIWLWWRWNAERVSEPASRIITNDATQRERVSITPVWRVLPVVVIILVAVAVAVWSYLTFWNGETEIVEPTAVLHTPSPRIADGSLPLRANQVTAIIVGLENLGPAIARDVDFVARRAVLITLMPSLQEEPWVSEQMAQIGQKLDGRTVQDLVRDSSIFSTLRIELDDFEVMSIGLGKTRLYVLQKFSWRDTSGEHSGESCAFLNPPGNQDVWKFCGSHNFVR